MEDPDGLGLALVGVRVQVRPGAETLETRLTVPAKPFRALKVIVEVPDVPVRIVTEVGPPENVKSGAAPTL
jgi:hypothetical protein